MRRLTGVGGILVFFLLWHAASVVINAPICPAPVTVLKALPRLFVNELYSHLGVSLLRIAAAMVISVCIGVPLGILTGYSRFFDRLLSPLFFMLNPLPKIALLPVIMVTLGIRERSKIVMMVLIILFSIIATVRDEIKKIPDDYFLPYRAINAGTLFLLRNIIFPAGLSGIFTALRNSFGAAVSVLFFAESYGTTYGMGFYILDMWMRVSYMRMYTGIVSLGILGICVYSLIELIERRVTRWAKH